MNKSTSLFPEDEDTLKCLFHFIFFVPPERSFAKRYGFAAVIMMVAFGLRDILGANLIYSFPFGFFIPATLLATAYGSFGAGIAAMVSGSVLGVFFFLEPHNNWGPLTTYGAWAFCLYTLTSSIGIALITFERMRNWRLVQELAEVRKQLIQALT